MRGIAWNRVIFCNKTKRVVIKLWLSICDTVIGAAPIWRWPSWFGALHQLQMLTVSWISNDLWWSSFFVPKVVSE